MNEKSGKVFSIVQDNPSIKGCTISKSIYKQNGYNINYFSLAENTDISAESYNYPKILFCHSGTSEVFTNNFSSTISKNEIVLLPTNIPVGIRTQNGNIYTEITIKKESNMNKIIEEGKIIKLTDLIPFQENRIVNMDLINDAKLKFIIMSFDKGTGLSEHSAPGEALICALEGEAIIGYEGKEYKIRAGENFKFAKNGKHYINATNKFKMSLLLTLD